MRQINELKIIIKIKEKSLNTNLKNKQEKGCMKTKK